MGHTLFSCELNCLCFGARETVDDVARTDEGLRNRKTDESRRSESK
jgi:hypothetical protein